MGKWFSSVLIKFVSQHLFNELSYSGFSKWIMSFWNFKIDIFLLLFSFVYSSPSLMVLQLENRGCPLKEQLAQLKPILDEMSKKKDERLRVLQEIRSQIQSIQREICPSAPLMEIPIHEKDLTQRKLEELQTQLQILHKEKVWRIFRYEH